MLIYCHFIIGNDVPSDYMSSTAQGQVFPILRIQYSLPLHRDDPHFEYCNSAHDARSHNRCSLLPDHTTRSLALSPTSLAKRLCLPQHSSTATRTDRIFLRVPIQNEGPEGRGSWIERGSFFDTSWYTLDEDSQRVVIASRLTCTLLITFHRSRRLYYGIYSIILLPTCTTCTPRFPERTFHAGVLLR
ncbi:hypothetical protein BC629DRAFT_1062644 [Irpex lacteus]|nr:hypothetical protein BC629DRAFT_1062644 [Irpex lacteus]